MENQTTTKVPRKSYRPKCGINFTIRLTKYQKNLLRYVSDLHPLEMDINCFYFILGTSYTFDSWRGCSCVTSYIFADSEG